MYTPENKMALLHNLYAPYKNCNGCHFNMPPITHIVFGEGDPNAKIMFIGEAPGAQEDLQARPFVGRSGKLLTSILEKIGIARADVFITNIVKCRPPNNRKPTPAEIAQSRPLLLEQITIINPRIICTLGSAALEGLLGHPVKITQLRGKPLMWHHTIVIPTYHPAFILRNSKKLPYLIEDITSAQNQASTLRP